VGHNLLQIFGPSFVKCYAFHIVKQQLIILSRYVQSKDCTARLKYALCTRTAAVTWAEELPFVLYGLHAQAVFGTPIVLPNEFLQGDKFSADSKVKKFKKNFGCSCFFFAQAQFQFPAAS
jgi:hypothetical protein